MRGEKEQGHLCLPLRVNYVPRAGVSIRPENGDTSFFFHFSPHFVLFLLSNLFPRGPSKAEAPDKYSSQNIPPSIGGPRICGEGELKAGLNCILHWRGSVSVISSGGCLDSLYGYIKNAHANSQEEYEFFKGDIF